MSISKRGTNLAKIGFDHGALNAWDPVDNPNGTVAFLYAENVRFTLKAIPEDETDSSDRD